MWYQKVKDNINREQKIRSMCVCVSLRVKYTFTHIITKYINLIYEREKQTLMRESNEKHNRELAESWNAWQLSFQSNAMKMLNYFLNFKTFLTHPDRDPRNENCHSTLIGTAKFFYIKEWKS